MKKSMMMIIAAGLLGFTTASAAPATDSSRPSDADTASVRGTMCNPPVNGQNGGQNQWQQNGYCPGPNGPMQQMRKPGARGMNFGARACQQQLKLDDRQSEQIAKLQKKHFELMAAEHRELTTLNRELRTASLKSNPDRRVIQRLSERIGRKHAELARMKSRHISEVGSILSPSQRNEMQKMIESRPMRGNCGTKCL